MSDPKQTSMIASATQALSISSTGAFAVLPVASEVCHSLAVELEKLPETDLRGHVILRLTAITGDQPTVLEIYLALPEGAAPAAHPEHRLGSIGLYGLFQASEKDANGEGGQGMGFSLDATKLFKQLKLAGPPVPSSIRVDVVPYRPMAEKARISIGKMDLIHVHAR